MRVQRLAAVRRRPVGLGSDAVPVVPGFIDGVKAWQSPGTAVSAISSTISGGDISARAAYLGGLAVVPVGALVLLASVMGGGRRRRR